MSLKKLTAILISLVVIFGWLKLAESNVLVTFDKAYQLLLPEAEDIKKEVKTLSENQRQSIEKAANVKLDSELDQKFVFHVGYKENRVVGYGVEDHVRGKWGIIRYIIIFNPDGSIKDTAVLEYGEKRGKPIAQERFRSQFRGKTIKDQFKLKRDIDGVSGATISSKKMTDGIKKMVYIFHQFYIQ